MRNLKQFRSLQKAVDSQERVMVDAGLYVIDEPIEFDDALLLSGAFGKQVGNVPLTMIRGSKNLGDRPMFHRRGYWMDSEDNWHDTTGKGGNQGTGCTVQLEHICFEGLAERGLCVQIFNTTLPSYVKCCSFGYWFRGLQCTNTFGMIIEGCYFSGRFHDIPWLDDEALVRRAWGLAVGNNCTITECNWQGGLTGLFLTGTGNRLNGGRIERQQYGIILRGPNLNPDVHKVDWMPSASCFYGFTLESNRCGIDLGLHAACRMSEFVVTGANAVCKDLTNGPCDWGIRNQYVHPTSRVENGAVSGSFKEGCVIGDPLPGIVLSNSCPGSRDQEEGE